MASSLPSAMSTTPTTSVSSAAPAAAPAADSGSVEVMEPSIPLVSGTFSTPIGGAVAEQRLHVALEVHVLALELVVQHRPELGIGGEQLASSSIWDHCGPSKSVVTSR